MAEQATKEEKDYIFNKVKGMDLKKERNELQSIKKNNNMKSISLDITKAASFLNEGDGCTYRQASHPSFLMRYRP